MPIVKKLRDLKSVTYPFYLKTLEKEECTKYKARRWREMRKVRVEINEIVNRKSLVVLIRKEREKIQGAYGGSVS